MSPYYTYNNDFEVTSTSFYSNPAKQPSSDFSIFRSISFVDKPLVKIESKKAKIKRIAKEKMFASWKVYNQKTTNIIEIKQICKPRHKINNYKK